MFDRHIIITVWNKDYSNRTKQAFDTVNKENGKRELVPRVDDKGKLVFEQVDIDLNETLNDVNNFNSAVLNNIKFKKEHTTEFPLKETTFDELKNTMT